MRSVDQLANVDPETRVPAGVLELGHMAVARRREFLGLNPYVGIVYEDHV